MSEVATAAWAAVSDCSEVSRSQGADGAGQELLVGHVEGPLRLLAGVGERFAAVQLGSIGDQAALGFCKRVENHRVELIQGGGGVGFGQAHPRPRAGLVGKTPAHRRTDAPGQTGLGGQVAKVRGGPAIKASEADRRIEVSGGHPDPRRRRRHIAFGLAHVRPPLEERRAVAGGDQGRQARRAHAGLDLQRRMRRRASQQGGQLK